METALKWISERCARCNSLQTFQGKEDLGYKYVCNCGKKWVSVSKLMHNLIQDAEQAYCDFMELINDAKNKKKEETGYETL